MSEEQPDPPREEGEEQEPKPPAKPKPAAPPAAGDPLDLERLSGAIGRGVATALRELGITEPKKESKSGDGDGGQAGGGGESPKRPHWFWGD